MDDAVAFALRIVSPVLRLAPATFLEETAHWLSEWGIQRAVAEHDTAAIYDWVVPLLAYQGIGDHAASRFAERHSAVTWGLVEDAMRAAPSCPRLRSHWHFNDCRYRKAAASCAEPNHIAGCVVPGLPLRKGSLCQAAIGLFLFLRDVCGGDFVGWIDARLATADPGRDVVHRGRTLRDAVLGPLCNVVGVGPKVWSMVLADLMLAADPLRERWVAAGAAFVAVDSLVHAFFHRTGILARFDAAHPYGNACCEPGGCADVIDIIAAHIDVRAFNAGFPEHFPRFVEKAIWHFCAQGGLDICNGRHCDDRAECRQVFCPCFGSCGRLPLSA